MTRLTSRRTWLEHSCRSQVQLPRLPLWSSNGAAGNQHDDSYGGDDDISDYDGEDPLVNLHVGWCTWSAGLWSLASHTSYAEKATIIQHGNGWHEHHQWQEYQHQHRITTFTMHHHSGHWPPTWGKSLCLAIMRAYMFDTLPPGARMESPLLNLNYQ